MYFDKRKQKLATSQESAQVSALTVKTCVLGAQKNNFNEMVILSTHNICFGREVLL